LSSSTLEWSSSAFDDAGGGSASQYSADLGMAEMHTLLCK